MAKLIERAHNSQTQVQLPPSLRDLRDAGTRGSKAQGKGPGGVLRAAFFQSVCREILLNHARQEELRSPAFRNAWATWPHAHPQELVVGMRKAGHNTLHFKPKIA